MLTTPQILALLAISLTTHADVKTPFGQNLPGSCNKATNYPLESEFTAAYTDFCTIKVSPDGTLIRESDGLTYTYSLEAGNGKKVDWVFRVSLSDGVKDLDINKLTDSAACLRNFGNMLERPIEEERYCVMDGTGGDALAIDRNRGKEQWGEGRVLVLGGKEEDRGGVTQRNGWFEFEARLKKT